MSHVRPEFATVFMTGYNQPYHWYDQHGYPFSSRAVAKLSGSFTVVAHFLVNYDALSDIVGSASGTIGSGGPKLRDCAKRPR